MIKVKKCFRFSGGREERFLKEMNYELRGSVRGTGETNGGERFIVL